MSVTIDLKEIGISCNAAAKLGRFEKHNRNGVLYFFLNDLFFPICTADKPVKSPVAYSFTIIYVWYLSISN